MVKLENQDVVAKPYRVTGDALIGLRYSVGKESHEAAADLARVLPSLTVIQAGTQWRRWEMGHEPIPANALPFIRQVLQPQENNYKKSAEFQKVSGEFRRGYAELAILSGAVASQWARGLPPSDKQALAQDMQSLLDISITSKRHSLVQRRHVLAIAQSLAQPGIARHMPREWLGLVHQARKICRQVRQINPKAAESLIPNRNLPPLTPKDLAAVTDAAGIQWQKFYVSPASNGKPAASRLERYAEAMQAFQAVGAMIEAGLVAKGLDDKQAASVLGITPGTWQIWESGKVPKDRMQSVADMLGLDNGQLQEVWQRADDARVAALGNNARRR